MPYRYDLSKQLPNDLFLAEQVRAMDRFAIDTLEIPGSELMLKAGRAAFQTLQECWPHAGTMAVACGAGNNGGDGYVVARLALEAGYDVLVYALAPVDRLSGDALAACQAYQAVGGAIAEYASGVFEGGQLVVDALLGTGLDREVGGHYAEIIESINDFQGPVLSLDIPSGLHADSGLPMGVAVRADKTITFIALKQGLLTGDAVSYCGELYFSSLSVPEKVVASQQPSARLLIPDDANLPRREPKVHKGDFGHVLVIGGDTGFTGAARLTAEAAGRIGAGLVSVATRKSHASVINLGRPEIMCHGVGSKAELKPLLERATVLAVGPGLGQSDWAKQLFRAAVESEISMVVDADGLNLLADKPVKRDHWILTPHPGEAARLLDTTTSEIQNDRFAAVKALQEQYGGVAILKGSGTLIHEAGEVPAVCRLGNPGMASGGMGDVLTGVAAGLLAQGLDLGKAARAAVYIHSDAGDKAARKGERGMLASDLMSYLRTCANP